MFNQAKMELKVTRGPYRDPDAPDADSNIERLYNWCASGKGMCLSKNDLPYGANHAKII